MIRHARHPPARPPRLRCLGRTVAEAVLALTLAGPSWLAPLAARAETDPRIVERYRQMLAANPTEGTALERLWKIATAEGFADKLLEEYRQLAEKGDFSGQMISGLLLHRAGREEESLAALRAAAKTDPKSPLPHLALAHALPPGEKGEELDQAAALFPPASPLLPEVLRQAGEAWKAAGQPEKAAQAWEKMVALNPENLDLRQQLVALYTAPDQEGRANLAEKAEAHLAYLETHGDAAARANALRTLARLRHAAGKTEEAFALLEKALALMAPTHWMRAEVIAEMIRYSQQARCVEALEARWKKEAQAAPRDPAPWRQLAELYTQEGQPKAERAALEKAVALAPGDRAVRLHLARLLAKLDDPKGAAALLDGVMAEDPGDAKNADLVFERAELDVRSNDLAAARRRIEALIAPPEESQGSRADPAESADLTARARTFFQQHRMFAALEAALRQPGADPVALAEFLLDAKRPGEARKALGRLVKPGDPPEARAAQHQRAADLLKEAGETDAAIEELRAAAALQPNSRALALALGDLCSGSGTPKSRAEAREAYTRAYTLSRADAERVEADQRLFRLLEGGTATATPSGSPSPTPSRESGGARPTLKTTARRMVATLLGEPGAPGASASGGDDGQALREFLAKLEAQTRDQLGALDPETWLRLARWQFWKHDLQAALAAVNQAVSLAPDAIPAHQLAAEVALALNDREAAATHLEKLAELARLAKADPQPWLKQLAQLKFQMEKGDEALAILEKLAASGDPAALADLALGQQQADRWYDALGTWEKLYAAAKHARRYEFLQPLYRVMQRLGLQQRAADLLWNAYEEQKDLSIRTAILHDLIASCRERGTMPWLLERLRARAKAPDAASFEIHALAQALKADGQADAAYRQLEAAAPGTPDRAAAEEALAREAEAMGDEAGAVLHQQRRLLFLPSPSAADWERLASLQEAALESTGADATRDGIVRRFPRDSDALLRCAGEFEKWGREDRAREILRAVRAFDPGNVPAAARLVRLLAGQEQPRERAEAAKAAEAVLAHSQPDNAGPLLLPPVEPLGNRLQALFASLTGGARASGSTGVAIFVENADDARTNAWRLEAIRVLAREAARDDASRRQWIARWQQQQPGDGARATVSERLWALHYAGADREAFALLRTLAQAPGANAAQRGAFLWSGLEGGQWEELARWLWNGQQGGQDEQDFDCFRTLLGEWGRLHRPLDAGTLFEGAPLAQVWLCAETLAVNGRVPEAAAVGQEVFGRLPSPITQLGGKATLSLARWELALGHLHEAEALLRRLAVEPADSLEAPTYAAQRALCLLLPETEREAWTGEILDKAARHEGRFASPVHAALTTALLQTLSGDSGAANAALDRLVTLRPGSLGSAPAVEQAWSFLLTTGIRLQLWHLDDAAIHLWERALADEASIALQGEHAASYASEIRMRLASIRLIRASDRETLEVLDTLARQTALAPLNQLDALVRRSGNRTATARVVETIALLDPGMPAQRRLSACLAAREIEAAKAIADDWAAHPEKDPTSAPDVLDFIAQSDVARATSLAEKLAEKLPTDPRPLTALARFQERAGQWKQAAESYRKLVELQKGNPLFLTGLANALAALGERDEALRLLATAAPRLTAAAVKRVELLLESDAPTQARTAAAEMIRGGEAGRARILARTFAAKGRPRDGLRLLTLGVENALDAHKPRAAFQLQKEWLRLADSGGGSRAPEAGAPTDAKTDAKTEAAVDPATRARGLRRLRRLAGNLPDLLSDYFELSATLPWRNLGERLDEMLTLWDDGNGSPVAGAWLVSTLLDTPDKAAPEAVLDTLLDVGGAPDALFKWLDARCKQANRHDLALRIGARRLARSPEDPGSAIEYARSLHALGREREAAATLERAALPLVFSPDFTQGGRLALAAQEIGDRLLARDLFAQAVAADPAALHTPVFLGYVRLLLADGDFPTAKRMLARAFRNPANRQAEAVVEYLRRAGRDKPENVPGELRDMELRPAVVGDVERLLGIAGD